MRARAHDRGFGLALAVYLAGLLGGLGVVAWLTRQPFLLPSLGPSAYLLATRDDQAVLARETVGGQAVGVLAAYGVVRVLLGREGAVSLLPHTTAGLAQVAAVVLAVGLATVAMSALRVRHAPAYATVLIFALGIPDAGTAVLVFLAAVLGMVGVHAGLRRVAPVGPVPVADTGDGT